MHVHLRASMHVALCEQSSVPMGVCMTGCFGKELQRSQTKPAAQQIRREGHGAKGNSSILVDNS